VSGRWAAERFVRGSAVIFDVGAAPSMEDAGGDYVAHLLQAFDSRGCPLKGCKLWSSDPTGVFRGCGWTHAVALRLGEAYAAVAGAEERARADKLEPFDEFAGLHAFER
jgi:hypothetical protein